MLQHRHIHRHVPLLSCGWRFPASRPSYRSRSSLCLFRAIPLHKDIDSVIFTEETIRERIAVMGRCAASFISRTRHNFTNVM